MTITPELIAALFAGIASVLTGFFAFSKWVINKFLKELKPNGGSSLKDQVNRLESRVDDIYYILANKENHG